MLKKIFLPMAAVSLLSTLGVSSVMAAGDLRIAYVKMITLINKSKPARARISRLKKEFGPRETKLKGKFQKFKSMEARLKKDHKVMSKTQVVTLQRKIRSLKRDLKRGDVEIREDLVIRRNEEDAKLRKIILKAIVSVAKRENYDLVLRQGVLYHSQRIDITPKIIKELAK